MGARIPDESRNAAAEAVTGLFDAGSGPGTVEIRDGTQPVSANDAASGSVLVTFTLDDPAFGTASEGTVEAGAIDPQDATGTGTATWFRGYDSDGNTVIDGDAGGSGSGADLVLSTSSIEEDDEVEITSWTITMPGA